jgi:hypothetical protein
MFKDKIIGEQQIYESQLLNHLTNIADFAKLNDINCFDNKSDEGMLEEQFLRGLLMNLELLSDKWKLIDKQKYNYRFVNNDQSLLPKDTGF